MAMSTEAHQPRGRGPEKEGRKGMERERGRKRGKETHFNQIEGGI
jgi:hypothetical protein